MGEHVVALSNPVASHASELSWRLDELERGCDRFGDFTRLQTIPNEEENRAQLYECVPDGSMLVVAGSDGTLSNTVRDVSHCHPARPIHLPRTPLIAFGTGNKNDVARMLSGADLTNPLHVMEHGIPTSVSTLDVSYSTPEGIEERELALYSFGVGAIGVGARQVNDPVFRAQQRERGWLGRHVAEYRLALDSLRKTRVQTIAIDGQPQPIMSLFFSNGDRMAGQCRMPASLAEEDFFVGFMRSKRLWPLLRDSVGLLTNHLPEGHLTQKPFEFRLLGNTVGQIDGEDFDMGAGPVRVSVGPAVTFLATRPQKQQQHNIPTAA